MPENQVRCQECGQMFEDPQELQRHNAAQHNQQQNPQQPQQGGMNR